MSLLCQSSEQVDAPDGLESARHVAPYYADDVCTPLQSIHSIINGTELSTKYGMRLESLFDLH